MGEISLDPWALFFSIGAAIAAFVAWANPIMDFWERLVKWHAAFGIIGNRKAARKGEPDRTATGGDFRAEGYQDGIGTIEYALFRGDQPLSHADVLDLWKEDIAFVDFFVTVFSTTGYSSYTWEMPPLTLLNLREPFRFVVQNVPSTHAVDADVFEQYYRPENDCNGIVAFLNTGQDALLVVPSPHRYGVNFSGLAQFFEDSTIHQRRSLWQMVAHHTKSRLSGKPLWISTAAGGVAWLHVRLDEAPKYYLYAPYKRLK